MPNEFIARNGLIALNNTIVSGSFNVSGSIEIPNSYYLNSRSSLGALINVFRIDSGNNFTFTNTASGDFYCYEGANVLARFINGGIINLGGTSATNSPVVKITTTGLGVGLIGSSPTVRLHVSGASTAGLLQIDSPASSSILYVSGSGRVGVGSSNPIATFDVINHTSSAVSAQIASFRTSASAGYISLYNYITPFEVARMESNNDIGSGGSLRLYTLNSGTMTEKFRITNDGQTYIGTGGVIPTSRLQVRGIGATSATTTFLLQNSTPANLMTVQDNGQITVAAPILALLNSQSAFLISQSISSSNVVGGQAYGVNITPTFWQTTASQTETAFRVAPTFNTSSTAATGGTNIIADFGATSVGSQLTVTDTTSGSIYMVNDVSGIPIIEATSDWTVNMYNFPTKVLQKTGSQVIISGSLWMAATSSFIFPLTSSTNSPRGSAYWSGSFLFIWDGLRYRSSSFA